MRARFFPLLLLSFVFEIGSHLSALRSIWFGCQIVCSNFKRMQARLVEFPYFIMHNYAHSERWASVINTPDRRPVHQTDAHMESSSPAHTDASERVERVCVASRQPSAVPVMGEVDT